MQIVTKMRSDNISCEWEEVGAFSTRSRWGAVRDEWAFPPTYILIDMQFTLIQFTLILARVQKRACIALMDFAKLISYPS
jgi:hypothetical protein